MKRLLFLLLIISSFSFGQFFTNTDDQNEFNLSQSSEPDMGVDEDGDDDEPPPPDSEAPIDDYLIYLTILGVLLGVLYNSEAKKRV
jgi:hypothetical protein